MSTPASQPLPFPVSERSKRTRLSSTAAVVMAADALRAKGVTVLDLGVGEPDFDTPEHIKQSAKQALDDNFTKYTSTSGIAPLRQAICDSINSQFGSDYQLDQCCVVGGGKQSIFNAVMALINEGDDVLLEKPSWVSFPEIVKFADGNVVWIETEDTDFHLTARQVKAALTPRTKLLIVNSPSNPTGRIIAPDEFQRIVEVAAENNVWVISDECYLQLVYPPYRPYSAAALPSELRDRVLIAGSLSKTFAMTGWRVGYTLGKREWVTEVLKVQSQSATHPSSISQKAAVTALTSSQAEVQRMLAAYQSRAAWLIRALNAIPGIICSPPEGAFYAFPNVKDLIRKGGFASSQEVANELLHKYAVVVTDGAAFGAEGYLRLSYATSLAVLQEAVARMQQLSLARGLS